MTDTPTPPMTPEQRAATVYALRYGNLHDIDPDNLADQLEADGVELARLTGMLDDYYPAVDWWILQAKEALEAQLKAEAALTAERDAAQAEIARLTAALATAREDGMRDGAEALRKTWWRGELASEDFDAITKGAAT